MIDNEKDFEKFMTEQKKKEKTDDHMENIHHHLSYSNYSSHYFPFGTLRLQLSA